MERLSNLEDKFKIVIEFLNEYSDRLSKKRKGANLSEEGQKLLRNMFLAPRERHVILQHPKTIPDPAVSIILGKAKRYDDKKLAEIQIEHQLSMAAENKVGELLEMYLAEKLEPYGWIWCSGDLVKAIDFIKKEENSWKCLQVKNRDNAENSSSSKIRDGSSIEKWFRIYSRKEATNWERFPDESVKHLLNEEDFINFIKETVSDVLPNS